tara:strand:- start:815 stop:2044 length:1230 start_codon:yes stop_codon:yes gene_type:complete
MSPAKLENITINIDIYEDDTKCDNYFVSKHQKVLFDGFTKLYNPYNEEDDSDTPQNNILNIDLKENTLLNMKSVYSIEKYTKPPHLRYTEASLIKKLDELGIGRPSTYSSMVTTVQDRKYVERKDKDGVDKKYNILKLVDDTIEEMSEKIKINGEKNKLIPTNIGNIVNTFLCLHFNNILDYNFTAKIETNLDLIAQGKKDWVNVVNDVYKSFNSIVIKLNGLVETNLDKNNYKRSLGIDPTTNFEICTYIAKYGPVVQLKNTDDIKKSKFAPLKDIKMEEVTMDQAIELLKYPYVHSKFNNKDVFVCKGKFGVYLKYDKKNVSLNGISEPNINSELIKNLLTSTKKSVEKSKGGVIKNINADIIIKDGPYGPYINYKNKYNIKIYSKKPIKDLNDEDCMAIINKKFKK